MRYYIDLEFIERGHEHPINLISIGVVSEDGREYYACNDECKLSVASDWVRENVLSQLPPKFAFAADHPSPNAIRDSLAWKSRQQIKEELLSFCLWRTTGFVPYDSYNHVNISNYDQLAPLFWGEWSSYDWVVFCQIFGTMMDLPTGFPMRCNDVIQWAETHLGIDASELPPSLETEGNHNALLGARTVKARYDWLAEKQKMKKTFRL